MLLLLHCLYDYAKDTLHYLQCKMVFPFLVYVSMHVCTCECVCMHVWLILNCNETAQKFFFILGAHWMK